MIIVTVLQVTLMSTPARIHGALNSESDRPYSNSVHCIIYLVHIILLNTILYYNILYIGTLNTKSDRPSFLKLCAGAAQAQLSEVATLLSLGCVKELKLSYHNGCVYIYIE